MIFKKMFGALRAQLNKLANFFWEADPIAQMQYEYDQSVEQLKEGRIGLEQYRGLVERVGRQVKDGEAHMAKLEAQAKAYLKAGNREVAAKFALELAKARVQQEQNKQQMAMHEGAYNNNLKKIQHANKKLVEVKNKIQQYDAELKMSVAEAEVAKLSQSFNMDVTTDFGQLESMIQGKIDANRGKAPDFAFEGSQTYIHDISRNRLKSPRTSTTCLEFAADLTLGSKIESSGFVHGKIQQKKNTVYCTHE